MEDSKEILLEGTGTPYLAIFNAEGTPIMDSLHGIPIGMFVTGFHYEYDEDKEDSGEIIIETDNVDIVSEPLLKYLMPLRLQWGWLYPIKPANCGPMRSVIITDHNIEFTPEGVKFIIKFSDATLLLKLQPAKYKQHITDFEKYLVNLLEGKVGVELVDYTTKEIFNIKVAQRIKEE